MWFLNCSSYCDARHESYYFFKEMPSSELIPVLLLQRIAELSPPSYILYTLVTTALLWHVNLIVTNNDGASKLFINVHLPTTDQTNYDQYNYNVPRDT